MPRAVTIVPKPPRLDQKKRVAAYARVSSGKDAMLHSLSAQVSYYSDLIQNHDEWLYVGVYTDEAEVFPKTSPGDSVRVSPMGKCICPISGFSVMKRARTGVQQWSRRKPESSD